MARGCRLYDRCRRELGASLPGRIRASKRRGSHDHGHLAGQGRAQGPLEGGRGRLEESGSQTEGPSKYSQSKGRARSRGQVDRRGVESRDERRQGFRAWLAQSALPGDQSRATQFLRKEEQCKQFK